MIYADTSFIASVYGADANSELAHRFIAEEKPSLPFTFLHWPELAKSFWTNQPDAAQPLWDLVKEDLSEGRKLYSVEVEADVVARRAAGLLIHFCPRWQKLRAVDAMHVTAAICGNFKTFLSFDRRSCQRILAATQKLKVWPPLNDEEKSRLK